MKLPLCFLLFLCLTAQAFGDPAADDAKALQGTWQTITAELAGTPLPEAVLKTITLKLGDGKYEVSVAGEPDKGIYRIDATARPKAITITGSEGPNKGRTFPAIYELSGDTLRICYDLSGTGYPKEFKTVAGTHLYLVTYQRKRG